MYIRRVSPKAKLPSTLRVLRTASIGVLCMASVAQAAENAAKRTKEATTSLEAEAVLAEVVVTGSRINRSFEQSSVPIQIISAENIKESGRTNIADLLNTMPQFGTGFTPTNTTGAIFGVGTNFVNLRNLGVNRTLVLVNGRRHVGAPMLSGESSNAVDLNSIPNSMIKQVQVITGGASAVYGSEAVAGVVNIILDDDFEGVQLGGQNGITDKGDAQEYLAYGKIGGHFADGRGYAVLGAEYFNQDGLGLTDREFTQHLLASTTGGRNVFNQLGSNPASALTNQPFFPNLAAVYDNDFNLLVNPDRTQQPFIEQATELPLRIPLERIAVRGMATHDISDNVAAFAEMSWFEGHSALENRDPKFIRGAITIPRADGTLATRNATIFRENPFLPAELAGLMDAAGATSTPFQMRTRRLAGFRDNDEDRQTLRFVAGLNGDQPLGDDRTVDWEIYYQWAQNRTSNIQHGRLFQFDFLDAVDAVRDASGNIVCRSELGVPAALRTCVPFNIFDPANYAADGVSPAFKRYLAEPVVKSNQRQEVGAFSATLDRLLSLPDGPVALAFGAEYRKESAENTPEAALAAGLLEANVIPPTSGGFDVSEVYVETRVPILSQRPFAHELSLEGAFRYSDYSTVGGNESWKYGGTWAPIPDIRFRAIQARAVRAPNIGELFTGETVNFAAVNLDPCENVTAPGATPSRAVNCAAEGIPAGFVSNIGVGRPPISGVIAGNPNLDEEQADTLTVGAVISPRFIPRLTLTVDYFDISVEGAIFAAGNLATILTSCYDNRSFPNQFCELFTRDPTTHFVTDFTIGQVNIQGLKQRGIDFQAIYQLPLGELFGGSGINAGDLGFQLSGTRLNDFTLTPRPGDVPTEFAGTLLGGANPEWRANATVSYENRGFGLSWSTRYLSSMITQTTAPDTHDFKTGDIFHHDLQLRYGWRALALRAGIVNVFDRQPERLVETFTGAGTIFDSRGRFFYLGADISL